MAEFPPFKAPTSYNTALGPMDELSFRQWLANVPNGNKIFNAEAPQTDYDMRGFWQGLQQGHPKARMAVNPNDNRMHFSDYWKNPTHETFSAESQWAGPGAPQWINGSQLASPSGRIIYDEQPGGTNQMVKALMGNNR